MYIDELEPKELNFEDIYLDPNNPRFWTEKSSRDIPDKKIADEKIQANTLAQIMSHGIEELYNSILRNGFLPLDRIVVREIEGSPDKYVVVEGNRRTAALTVLRQRIDDDLIDEEHIDEEYLQNLKHKTDHIEVLVYNGQETHDIAWLLQGVRHISGIRNWEPAQRARLVAEQIEKEGMSFKEAGQQFGLTPQAVGRLYRSYKALEQMREDEDFQTKARNDYFTLFEEAYRNKYTRRWLGWDDEQRKYTEIDNLKQFYSWITPDDEHPENRRRIHDPRQIKQLGFLVEEGHTALLDRVDQHDLTIEIAYDRATHSPAAFDWRRALSSAGEMVAEIPQDAIQDNAQEFVELLGSLETKLANAKKMALALIAND